MLLESIFTNTSSYTCLQCVLIYQVIPQAAVQALFAVCKTGEFDAANKEVNNVISEGYPVPQMLTRVICLSTLHAFYDCIVFSFAANQKFIRQLFELIVSSDDISDVQKARICKKLAEADKVCNQFFGSFFFSFVNSLVRYKFIGIFLQSLLLLLLYHSSQVILTNI